MTGIVLLVLRIALTAALYSFLGLALWLVWRELRQEQRAWTARQVSPLSLDVHLGDKSHQQRFISPEVTIGRDPSCDCVLASKTVSAHHARLSFHQGQWWLEDLESTNGTKLNKEVVTAPTVLAPNDQITCGEAVLTVKKPKG